MQTVETLNEGLKRAYTLTIAAGDIAARVEAEVARAAPQVRMPGFRPGKVPANLVRKMHGLALERDALNTAVQEGVQSLLAEQGLRPATQPEVALDEEYAPGKDVEVKVALEVLPQVPAPQIEGLTLERLTVAPEDAAVEEQLARFAAQQNAWADAAEGHPAVEGDQVTVDFVGKTADGVAFPGGTGTDMAVELGAGRLIPGFEQELEGITLGEDRVLNVTFPADYPETSLAGKPATFEVTVKAIKTPVEPTLDDEFAKTLGLDGIDKLRDLFRGQAEQELNGLTRTHMKRKLLDQLAASHDFEVPPSMVEAEFAQIWQQLEHEATHEADPEAARVEMEGEREDYRKIAERRVRLGLLLSEIGQQNGVEVSQQEMQRLAMQAAQQYAPKDRERFLQYVQENPVAAAQLRAPLYEDKVVDFLFDKAAITDRPVSREELEAAIEAIDDGSPKPHVHGPDCDHDHDHEHGHAHGGDHAHDHADEEQVEGEAKPKKARTKPAAKSTGAVGATVEAATPEPADVPADASEGEPKPAAKRARKPATEAEG